MPARVKNSTTAAGADSGKKTGVCASALTLTGLTVCLALLYDKPGMGEPSWCVVPDLSQNKSYLTLKSISHPHSCLRLMRCLVLHIFTGIRLLIWMCFPVPNCAHFIYETTFCISFRYSTVQNNRQENIG